VNLLVFGLGFSGAAIARDAARAGHAVSATSRHPTTANPPPGVRIVDFAAADEAVAAATHIVSTAAPDAAGDPILYRYGQAMRAAPDLRWVGYISTTGVYGDRDGGWVDEHTEPAPGQERSVRRLAAEQEWRAFAAGRLALDLFRTAGIYGPGRSALDDVRAGRARRVVKPGHAFGRIHRDDIAGAVLAAAMQNLPPGVRVLHLSDAEPAATAEVVAYACALRGAPPPPEIPFEQAASGMGEMARSFWAENRRVDSRLTQQWLGRPWRYPSFREGLRAILEAEGL
jgi:nucleoside-diphosphate-sugar epimerase